MEFGERMGFEYKGQDGDDQVIELEIDDRHMSRAERAHGGVLFSMLDTALGRAIIERLPPGRGCATVEVKINYFRPVQQGRIQARARCKEITRSLAYAEGAIYNGEGKALARASGTFFLTDTMAQKERERV